MSNIPPNSSAHQRSTKPFLRTALDWFSNILCANKMLIFMMVILLTLTYNALNHLQITRNFFLLRENEIAILKMIDVGQGDGFEISLPTGHKVVIDVGADGARFLNGYKDIDVKKSDLIFLTHDDADHAGGLSVVLKKLYAKNIGVSNYFYSYLSSSSDFTAKNKVDRDFNILKFSDGDKIIFTKDYFINVLHPNTDRLKGHQINNNQIYSRQKYDPINRRAANDDSLVMKFNIGSTTILFTGDISEKVEKLLVNNFSAGLDSEPTVEAYTEPAVGLESDILKIGHHGSKTSSSYSFIKNVNPKIALISAGYKNRYGHPHKSVMQTLADQDIKIFRTDIVNACGSPLSYVSFYLYKDGAIGYTPQGLTSQSTSCSDLN